MVAMATKTVVVVVTCRLCSGVVSSTSAFEEDSSTANVDCDGDDDDGDDGEDDVDDDDVDDDVGDGDDGPPIAAMSAVAVGVVVRGGVGGE